MTNNFYPTIFAKHKIIPYRDNSVWADNETAQKFKEMLDVPSVRMYAGRRIFRILNRYPIRKIMNRAKFLS